MPLCGQLQTSLLNRAQASLIVSISFCSNVMMSLLLPAFTMGGKYFWMNFFTICSHIVISLGSVHCHASSLSDNGKRESKISSSVTPGIEQVLQISIKLLRCASRSSPRTPPNCLATWSICNIISFISNLLFLSKTCCCSRGVMHKRYFHTSFLVFSPSIN